MSIKTKMLAAALVFSAAVAASAATAKHKIAIRQSGLPAHMIPSPVLDPDPDDPLAVGGGSLGYNQALHYWW